MRNFYEKEDACALVFMSLGEIYHLWTPEGFEIIFRKEEDFHAGMGIIGICAKLFPDIRIITFEIMTNHLHVLAAGTLKRLMEMFALIKKMLIKYFESEKRTIDWIKFEAKTRRLTTLEDVRNVIAYDNRNGYIVHPEHSPYTYPWGANRYYFNPDASRLAQDKAGLVTIRELRTLSHSRAVDEIKDLKKFDGYALPLSFCNISTGENLFRDASHYFYKISKSIESGKEIAKEIGEGIFYTDDEIFAVISALCRKQFSEGRPSLLPPNAKIDIAKIMRHEYNASAKQISRILKLSPQSLESLGI